MSTVRDRSGRSLAAALSAAFLALAITASWAEDIEVGLSQGELPFRLRSFAFPAAGDSTRLLVLGTLRADRLHWESDDSLRASLDLAWQLHSGGALKAVKTERLELVRPLDMERIEGQLLVLSDWILEPGHYRMEFRAEDPRSRRGGLAGLFGRPASGHWSGRIEAKRFREGQISDILLYSVGPDSLARPNPWSSFEGGDPFLDVFAVLRPDKGASDLFSLTLELRDESGESILRKRGEWMLGEDPFPLRFRIPTSGLEDGDYEISLLPEGPSSAAGGVEAAFQVLPRARRTEDQQLREQVQADLLLKSDARAEWESRPPTQRSEVLRLLWEARDPDPREPGNPVRDEFIRRFAQASRLFGSYLPGPLSDRGRIWIQLGEPDEILVDVLPENQESLQDAVGKLHESDGEIGPSYQLDRDLGHIGLGGPGSPGVESEAFEMWIYRLGGAPLLPELALELKEVDLKLIFVDRQGTGEYVLEFSSEEFDF